MSKQSDSFQIRIEPWADDNLDLLRGTNTQEMTDHLGGPETEEQLVARHNRYLEINKAGIGRMYSIVLLPNRVEAGSIGYWDKIWHGETVYEMGWSVLPQFQGKGIAAAATATAVSHAKSEQKHRFIYAFPSVDNLASNAICRKNNFSLLGECEFEYPKGSFMRCNEWRLDLTTTT
ncbi:N-acetyltransferase [Brevibacillus fluminis]|uniref:N-acetyltransferase n=1 Tax=Brevibacillus fluminis TaxID=511487 RepID=A0A3M8DGQ9_9BACL|nr:GNAT family N-acetyltransferase [Brevibacillus fluminis]RNB87224.1 N-acetyltransferase [Brevibacillus fluminis]